MGYPVDQGLVALESVAQPPSRPSEVLGGVGVAAVAIGRLLPFRLFEGGLQ